jgi:hypothetical protein
MNDFFEFMRCQGVSNPKELMDFVKSFLDDPGMINKFSKAELTELENRLDFALAPFSNKESE